MRLVLHAPLLSTIYQSIKNIALSMALSLYQHSYPTMIIHQFTYHGQQVCKIPIITIIEHNVATQERNLDAPTLAFMPLHPLTMFDL